MRQMIYAKKETQQYTQSDEEEVEETEVDIGGTEEEEVVGLEVEVEVAGVVVPVVR